MSNPIAVDLRSARKKSGLTEEDCAHLLGVSKSTISRFETGKAMPGIRHLATLSLVYGRDMHSLAHDLLLEIGKRLPARLTTIPVCSDGWSFWDKRNNTLNNLDARLQKLNDLYHGSA